MTAGIHAAFMDVSELFLEFSFNDFLSVSKFFSLTFNYIFD